MNYFSLALFLVVFLVSGEHTASAHAGRRLSAVIQHETCNLIAIEPGVPTGTYFDHDATSILANKGYIARIVTRDDYNEMIRQQLIPADTLIFDFHAVNREERVDHIGDLVLGRSLACQAFIDFTHVVSLDPFVTRGSFNLTSTHSASINATRAEFRQACRQAFVEILSDLSNCELQR